MRSPVTGIAALFVLFVVLIVAYSSVFTVVQTEQVLVVRLGEPIRVVTEPGLNLKAPLIDTVISIDKRRLDPGREHPADDAADRVAAPRARRGHLHHGGARRARGPDGADPRPARQGSRRLRHPGGRCADQAR